MKFHKVSINFVVLLPLFQMMVGNAFATVVTDWIVIGDPGNPEDTIIAGDGSSGYGSVDHAYRIAEYEVSNAQYAEFLNAVAKTDPNQLYWTAMNHQVYGGIVRSGNIGNYTYGLKPNMANKPVNYVSWFDSARYANWIHNGQPVGPQDASTTEDGAYTFTGFETVGPRNPGATVFLPNEHEWHKAAFYEPGAVTADGDEWWLFTTRSDSIPITAQVDTVGNITNPGPNVVNYGDASNWNGTLEGNSTTIGSAGNQTYYGVKDIGGNVFEWVEADLTKPDFFEAGPYVVRGGAFSTTYAHIKASERNDGPLSGHTHNRAEREVGIRLASIYDSSGNLDGADLAAWQASYGQDDGGDRDGDGDTDGTDFLIWQQRFDSNPSANSVIVPEPSSLALASLGCLTLGWRFALMTDKS